MNAYKDMLDSMRLNKIESELAQKNFLNLVGADPQREADDQRQAEHSQTLDKQSAKHNTNVEKKKKKNNFSKMNNNWYYWFH